MPEDKVKEEVMPEAETNIDATEDAKPKRQKQPETVWLLKHKYTDLESKELVEKQTKVKGPISRAVRRARKLLDNKALSGESTIAAEDPATLDLTAQVTKAEGEEATRVAA